MSFDITTALPAVTLEKAKLHLRVDHDLDDSLIETYILAATERGEHILGREIIRRVDDDALANSVDSVPRAVQSWVMCSVADLYETRETSGSGKSEGRKNYDHLLDAFRLF